MAPAKDPFLKQSVILIVDDNHKNLQVLGSILKENNYLVAVAKDGTSAISLASKVMPDLILLDIMMPGMSGFETCVKLNSMEKTREIPVIFLSARSDSDDIIKGFTSGGVDYITKPFIKEELLARIRNHLGIKHTEQELRELILQKDKFFSIIAHDLKNPITSLVSLVDLLHRNLDKYDKKKIEKMVLGISEAAQTQYKLQENLLEWSRIQTGTVKINMERFNVLEVINEAIGETKSSAMTKNIEVVLNADKDCFVVADKNMINTVFRNIISNAIKFSFKDSKVTINCKKNQSRVDISIVDQGVGINGDRINSIFKLKSVSTPGTDKEKGTGLGLVVCKEFIEKNEGEIQVDSKEGKGSVFTITLPLDN